MLLTARPLRVQAQTVGWLERYHLRWDLLIMRDHGDYDYAEDFKHYSVQTLKARGIELVLAFEDDPRNVMMLRSATACPASTYTPATTAKEGGRHETYSFSCKRGCRCERRSRFHRRRRGAGVR